MKNVNSFVVLTICFLLTAPSCTKQRYEKALANAAQPNSTERSFDLTKISTENPNLVWKEIGGERYVLVSSWKADAKYYKNDPKTGFYNTGKYPIWVTAAPDLQKRLAGEHRKFKKTKPLDKRLKQLLGLPPNADKKVFVEFWVRPQDLIRPCVDPEVTDNTCDLFLPKGASPDCENLVWLADQARASFADSTLYQRYPFTQLGYTYDWKRKNKSHVGLSEFVIGKNKDIVVGGIFETAEYVHRK
ncbi:MAG: hypothetical protein IPM82_23145 [Saprospiraceae bacterium]|nr:hypothetical protein [Saprospiraceae bacterium]